MQFIKLLVVDPCGELVKKLGIFTRNEIESFVEVTTAQGVCCLKYIDTKQDTFFSEKQLLAIRMQLLKIENTFDLNKNLLEKIQEGIKIALEEGYLKFEPTN